MNGEAAREVGAETKRRMILENGVTVNGTRNGWTLNDSHRFEPKRLDQVWESSVKRDTSVRRFNGDKTVNGFREDPLESRFDIADESREWNEQTEPRKNSSVKGDESETETDAVSSEKPSFQCPIDDEKPPNGNANGKTHRGSSSNGPPDEGGEEAFPESKESERRRLISMIEKIFDPEDLPVGYFGWEEEKRHRWIVEKGTMELFNVPATLGNVIPATMRAGDCGRSPEERPAWLDPLKFRRGQMFAVDHAFGLYFANMLSLFMIFAPQDALRPMIVSGKSGTPYSAFKRYLSTIHRVRNWYRGDPWTAGTAAYKDVQAVRRMHWSMRQRLCGMSNEEIDRASLIQDPWCPASGVLREDFQEACPLKPGERWLYGKWGNSVHRPKLLNQGDMAMTQFAFMGLPILYPEHFGIHYATDDDLDAFCHLWRGIGYMLGIEDEYNFCRGDLEEVRQRSRDMIDAFLKPSLRYITAEWEHMTRCLVEGIYYYFPGALYASSVLYVCQLIGVPVPRYRKTVSFTAVLYMEYQRLVLCYLTRWALLKKFLNKVVNYAIDTAVRFDAKIHARLEQRSERVLLDRPYS